MLTAAAAWLTAAGMFGFVAAVDGDVLLGWAAILTALAGVIAAVGTSVANLRKTTQVQQAVGPPNGRTVQDALYRIEDVLHEVKDFEQYQHDRNHDVLNHLATLTASQPTLIRLVEQLAERLTKENP